MPQDGNVPNLASNNGTTDLNGANNTINNVQNNSKLDSLASLNDKKSGLAPNTKSSGAKGLGEKNGADLQKSLASRNILKQLSTPEGSLALKKEIAAKALKSYGIPEFATKKILNSKNIDKKLMKLEKLQSDPFGVRKKKLLSKSESEKKLRPETAEEKSDREIEEAKTSGEVTLRIPFKKLKIVLLIAPPLIALLLFVTVTVAIITDDKVQDAAIGEMSSSEKKEFKSFVKNAKDGLDDDSGTGPDDGLSEYYERIKYLGNLNTLKPDCEGEECYDRAEFLYYLKIANLSYRYEEKYKVKLDWYLIMATDLYFDKDDELMMEDNLGGYDADKVENLNITSGLDWDNDYTKISGYQYLDADDSTYDLQILAKNMVRKKTVQTCTDSSGKVVKTQEDEDIEDRYLSSDKKLSCGGGESYSIKSTYTLDKDKYDDFLLEYIDKKIYTKGSGKKKNGRENKSDGCVSTNGSFVWPIGSMEITSSNGVDYALGDPYTTTITSYFGSKEGFRVNGHGAIDIAGGSNVGVIPVIASKSGTVVYPTSSSQTGYADNGYLGNNDGGGYGNYVIIDHGDGTYTLYAHLARNSITVMAGDTVSQGQVIAKLGHSGSSTGPHLHFEVRDGGGSSTFRVDPLNYVDPKNPRNGASSGSCENMSMADAFVKLAVSQINDPEAVNGKKYWTWFGRKTRFEWCAAFVSWVVGNFEYNGKTFDGIINLKGAAVSQWINYFYKQDNLEFIENNNCSRLSNGSTKYKPKVGDIIFFDWDNNWDSVLPTPGYRADHVGIVQRLEGNKIITIEGNSSNSVAERSYNLDSCQVIGFGSWY